LTSSERWPGSRVWWARESGISAFAGCAASLKAMELSSVTVSSRAGPIDRCNGYPIPED